MLDQIKVLFSEGSWKEEVDFSAVVRAIVDFVKAILKNEFGFEF